ncbi:MAG TPA: hypothetical protein VHP81_00605 [Lachnospiraceae bacterium]|nr:hypothetical protein [Lachnospiraceae bacterium]
MEEMNELKEKKARNKDAMIEVIIVVMLGITALLTAWASWIGSLHGGNQATNYADANNLASEGNSEYNAGVQSMNQDMLLWNEISDLQIDILFAQDNKNEAVLNQSSNKLFFKLNDNLSEEMATAIGWDFNYTSEDPQEIVQAWMEKDEALQSPFTEEDFITTYFEKANALLGESQEKMEEGQKDNTNGDAFGLVTVIYSVVLFLLGIAGSFDSRKNRNAVIIISLVSFIVATIYMLTLPLPAGFSITSFFKH